MFIPLSFTILILVFSSIFGYFLFIFDGIFGGYDFTSSKTASDKVIKIISDRHSQSGKFYDLGSCRGRFAARLAKHFPNLHIVGIDNSRVRVFFSKARAVALRNLKFIKQDIFTADVSTADIVYLYLPQELMPALQNKLQKELKHGSLIISNSVHFENWQPSEIITTHPNKPDFEKLFIYNI